jgi:hypothetical protein
LEAYLRQQQAIMARPDSRPGLSAIKCPTVMIVGEQDAGTPPELAREIADAIPGSHLVVIPAGICRRSSGRKRSPRRWSNGCSPDACGLTAGIGGRMPARDKETFS